ncbi:CACTA en-spm transposon protein [Cucumis melo var. makuwa]|uniref:CACTA en-spm transposon protein n=1 Tax=Cucumis melo var. makuwa TaxID=1194695 RepID=A0A5A7T8H8_CUCMM|nr:CACTA en-spm transposon protein [Cucumis melo var. makuwa]TYK18460.1 CACTA en-spm transposon protein [Cucumis melo var. makuwa]
MPSFPSGFNEIGAMFLEFTKDPNNAARGSSSVGDNLAKTTQPSLTSRRCTQSRLLELEFYVHSNWRIPVSMPLMRKSLFNHTLFCSTRRLACVAFLMLDFNDQTMNRFIKHQMLTTYKEFMDDCHRHFKKHGDPKEARANPPQILVGCVED